MLKGFITLQLSVGWKFVHVFYFEPERKNLEQFLENNLEKELLISHGLPSKREHEYTHTAFFVILKVFRTEVVLTRFNFEVLTITTF